jgi:CHAT domain-containing protein
MEALYDARFAAGKGTAEAVREADRALLSRRRAQGGSTHPHYWAGFIAVGDWR